MREVDPLDVLETIREGLLVLAPDLTIRFANRSFCNTFAVAPEHTIGRKIHELGSGQWDIPKLRSALETIASGHTTIEAFEVDHVFPSIGRRVMVLNARAAHRPDNNTQQILLAIEDITERVRLERERSAAHERVVALMQELVHRVKNNLQLIASMVSIEIRRHVSGEGKAALERVSHRINALGALYCQLQVADSVEPIDATTYLDGLCRDLVASVSNGGAAISIETDIDSVLLPTEKAIPIGLIVNELVTNAVKFAFAPNTKGRVLVTLKREPGRLRLTVADDGSGIDPARADSGLGGRLVEGFAQQLGGHLERESGKQGTTVCLILPSPEG